MLTLFQRVRRHCPMLAVASAVLSGAFFSALWPVEAAPSIATSDQAAFFEKRIRPVLSENCYSCHGSPSHSSGHLRLDSREGLLKGGRTGPAIIPGDPAVSLLIARLTTGD
jgi:Planctomycete cytochrome C